MDRSEHHARAEELLGQADAEQDSIRRSLILAEAQVHATLALSAPAGTSPPGPGQPETVYATHVPAGGRIPDWSEASAGFVPAGETVRGSRYPPGEHPLRQAEERRASGPAAPPPAPAIPGGKEPSTTRPAYPKGWKRPQEQPQEPEPGSEEQSPAADDPGKQDPGGPAPFRMT
jgi:hypothetical protein